MSNITNAQASVARLSSVQIITARPRRSWSASLWQFVRFSVVGILNTAIDILTLNLLLWHFPTHDATLLLFYNSIAYTLGALNSFGLNKYWTFRHKWAVTGGELLRFAIVSMIGILCNDAIIWSVARLLHPLIANNLLWANASKGSAIIGSAVVSYIGMRLWVFAKQERSFPKRSFPIRNKCNRKRII